MLQALTKAWNTGNSTAFASQFAEDGDMINIHGMRLRGRAAIAGLYDMLFRSVFHRSRVKSEIKITRQLCEDTCLIHLQVDFTCPIGPMAGEHHAVCSMVAQRRGNHWQAASLHNTLVSAGAAGQLVA